MNRIQRGILIAAAILVLLSGLFPPAIKRGCDSRRLFLLSPRGRCDGGRLAVEWLTVLAASGLLCLAAGDKKKPPQP